MQIAKKIIKEKIITDITTMILEGVLHEGDLLPSIRIMSNRYKVSRGTVMLVYKYVESMGYIQGYERSGYLVTRQASGQRSEGKVTQGAKNSRQPLATLSVAQHYQKLVDRQPCLLPLHFVKRCTFDQDRPPLHRQPFCTDNLLRFLTLARGIYADNQQVLLFPGRQEALTLLALFMLRQQKKPVIIVESPCERKIERLFEMFGFKVIKIPVDAQGLRVEELPPIHHATVLCMPSLQFPTATRLSPHRRQQLTDWAELYQGTIIEDDSYSMLEFGQNKTSPLYSQSLTSPLIYLTELRELTGSRHNLGIVIAPRGYLAELIYLQQALQTSVLPASFAVVDAFLGSSYFMKYLTALLDERTQKKCLAFSGISDYLPQIELRGQSSAGFAYLTVTPGDLPPALINHSFFLVSPQCPSHSAHKHTYLYPFALLHLYEIKKINKTLSLGKSIALDSVQN